MMLGKPMNGGKWFGPLEGGGGTATLRWLSLRLFPNGALLTFNPGIEGWLRDDRLCFLYFSSGVTFTAMAGGLGRMDMHRNASRLPVCVSGTGA
jgi:hypothetical protein